MAENFDIGPLTWVKDEINQSLDAVLENLNTLQGNMHDTAVLRFSQTYLYQTSGALDMVGLEGCKRFCSELEKLAKKIEQHELEVNSEIIEAFVKAVKTLKYYIRELLNGAPDIPLRLYPVLNPIVTVQGETIDESELFFPDTSNSAPKDIPSKEFSDEEYAHFIIEQRLNYQKSLLSWLQTKQYSAVESMRDAISNVSQAQHKASTKTLWWAASAFTETLEIPAIAENASAKKLCRRLDQELRQLVDGVNKPHNSLLRDILYFVAISEIDKETVRKVKDVFELDQIVDKQSSIAPSVVVEADELTLVERFKTEIEGLRDIWSEVSDSIDFNLLNTVSEQTLVDLDNVLITRFVDKMTIGQELSSQLSQKIVVNLFNALLTASETLRDDKTKVNHTALIEVATALHLLDSALTHYKAIESSNTQHYLAQIARLEAIAAGTKYEHTAVHDEDYLDPDTLIALVKDIHASLKIVEQALDTFFRNTADKSSLVLAPKPLKQISAIFEILVLPTPKAVVDCSAHLVAGFNQSDYQPSQADFELIAESLSMVGLYTDELPKPRHESESAMTKALERLKAAVFVINPDLIQAEKTFEVEDIAILKANIVERSEQSIADSEISSKKVLDQAHDAELLEIYLIESEEVLAHIAQNLQALRINQTNHDALVEVRRSFHTLKGSGRTVGLMVLGNLAGDVETFLNKTIDRKLNLDINQISQIEEIATAFASWVVDLKASAQVSIQQGLWQDKIKNLDAAMVEAKSQEDDEFVLVGGTLKVSRNFYDIFMNESMQNITKLEQDVVKLNEQDGSVPSLDAQKANHTLASNALAIGLPSMGNLCRALERFLDEANRDLTPQHIALYSEAVKTIAEMWHKVSELKLPRAAKSLTKLLNEASDSFKIAHNSLSETPTLSLAEQEMLAEEAEKNLETADLPITADEVQAAPEESQPIEPVVTEPVKDEVLERAHKEPTLTESVIADNSEVDQELLNIFIEEAQEIIPEIGSELRAWRANPSQNEHPEGLLRALHTFKGNARMAKQLVLGDIAHELEDMVIATIKRSPDADAFEAMFVDLDKIGNMFERTLLADDTVAPSQLAQEDIAQEERQNNVRGVDRKQYLRLSADSLNRLINEAGEISIIRSRMDRELIGFKQYSHDLTDSLTRLRNYLRELEIEAELQMQSRMNVLQETNETFDPLEFDRFTRLQELTRMIAESVNDVGTIQSGLLVNLDQTEAALQQQSRMNRDLQQGLLSVRMLPFRQIVDRLRRIVRQTARELDKSVDLVIVGEATEVDRSVLDKLGAPLEHLLRNAVAHGIESKKERKALNKPDLGIIRLVIKQQNDEIQIAISDDGSGVNLAKVKEKAIKNNLLNESSEISEQALLGVIFETGFSTADEVTQIAGRGVGLDVVRSEISALGGRVDLTSEPLKGSTFSINLPVTQSVAQVLMVRSGQSVFALPVALIEQAQKIKRNELTAAYVAGEITWSDSKYPLHHLAKLLDHEDHQIEDFNYASILLLRSGAYTLALHVDEVVGNQEVVVKSIGAQLSRVPGVVGATVSGDGHIILIINPVQVANREILSAGNVSVKTIKRAAVKKAEKLKAMVVDDSLTMRKVLGRLLEREGYEVLLAKDGMDAIQLLQETVPDVILTDIEMPRMDGFGLSRNIRDDARFASTPLIMISSRTADKHQNLAKEIGVNAFFGKPVQDEELVTKVKQLIADSQAQK